MLSVKKEYGREDIERLLEEHTQRRGITNEELERKVQGELSMHDLLCDLVEEALLTAREVESAELRRRQREGMTRAQELGVTLGRPSKRSDKRFEKIRELYEDKRVSAEDAAKRLHVSISTFYRWLRQSRNAENERRKTELIRLREGLEEREWELEREIDLAENQDRDPEGSQEG